MLNFRQAFLKLIGQQLDLSSEFLDQFLAAYLCGEHVLLEGPPGTGKTTLATCLGNLIGEMGRVQMTPDIAPSDILGTEILVSTQPLRTEFRPGPIFKKFLMIDEINRAVPRVQSALLQAMAERRVDISGESRLLDHHFFVLATQNPYDMDGTFLLPMSQWDRFGLVLEMPISEGERLEKQLVFMLNRDSGGSTPRAVDSLHVPYFELPKVEADWFRVIRGLQNFLIESNGRGDMVRPLSLRAWVSWLKCGACLSQLRGKDHLSTSCLRELLVPALLHRCSEGRQQEIGQNLLLTYDKLTSLR